MTIDTGLKSTISYTPSTIEVSDFILAGNGVDALNFAMSQLVDGGINWELNTLEQRVDYKDTTQTGNFHINYGFNSTTPEEACRLYLEDKNYIYGSVKDIEGSGLRCFDSKDANIAGIGGGYGSPVTELKSIPIDVISTQILVDAVANNIASQDALTQITINEFANDEFAAELDANATPFS